MALGSQLLRSITDPALGLAERAQLRCQAAKAFEDSGNYESARAAMGDLWQRVGERPRLEGLDEATAAEVLLRAGALSGWIGSTHQIESAQETAKNLISESAAAFEALGESEKVAEAYIDLAICYWREGGLDEARVTLQEAQNRLSDQGGEQKARALLNRAIIEISSNRFHDALHLFSEAAPIFAQSESHPARGRYHMNYAAALKKLGVAENREEYFDSALVEYAAASYHLEQAGHVPYRAAVENNLGFLLYRTGRFADAYEHLDRAHLLFSSLKDSTHMAQVDDTRARVLLAQKRNNEAEKVSRSAVRALDKGDQQSILAEALTTYGVVLARLGRYEESLLTLERALDVSSQAGDTESAGVAALTVVEELQPHVKVDGLTNFYRRADAFLGSSQNAEIIDRLRISALSVLEACRSRAGTASAPHFVYADERTERLLRTAHTMAAVSSPVLITGESGTGKELLARMIHEWSGRSGDFVVVNCAALTDTLLESILSGGGKGDSFSSTGNGNGGRRVANRTVFLDEVAQLTPPIQSRLLRVIEEQNSANENVRVIASTTRDLNERVVESQFDKNLLSELAKNHLEIPPLRDRTEDIPAIASHLIAELTERHNRRIKFKPEAIEAIRSLPLKGNARELRSFIERVVLSAADGMEVTRESVEALTPKQGRKTTVQGAWAGCSFEDEVLRYEASLIRLALENSKGSVTNAARLLGVTHQRLCSMIQNRHKDLVGVKKPAQKRKRSIIKKK